jgi:hypothetical protein
LANPNPGNRDKLLRGGPGRPKHSKNKLTRERVERELRYIALSDPIALFDRVAKGKREFRLREINAMSEDMRRCIASVKVKTENLTAGDGAQDTTVEIKLWEKTKALELCARALGMLKDHVVVEDLTSRKDRLRAALLRTTPTDGD